MGCSRSVPSLLLWSGYVENVSSRRDGVQKRCGHTDIPLEKEPDCWAHAGHLLLYLIAGSIRLYNIYKYLPNTVLYFFFFFYSIRLLFSIFFQATHREWLIATLDRWMPMMVLFFLKSDCFTGRMSIVVYLIDKIESSPSSFWRHAY